MKVYTYKQLCDTVGLFKDRCSTLVELKDKVMGFLAGPNDNGVLLAFTGWPGHSKPTQEFLEHLKTSGDEPRNLTPWEIERLQGMGAAVEDAIKNHSQ